MMRITFRNGFIAGVLLAVIIALWLFQLWQPARQVQLHSEHLISAVEDKDKDDIAAFVDHAYRDQWGEDRAMMLERLLQLLAYARNLRLHVDAPIISGDDEEGNWSARVTLEADPNEISDMIKTRVNALDAPFELHWQRKAWKPWDWKLVRVSNSALELSANVF